MGCSHEAVANRLSSGELRFADLLVIQMRKRSEKSDEDLLESLLRDIINSQVQFAKSKREQLKQGLNSLRTLTTQKTSNFIDFASGLFLKSDGKRDEAAPVHKQSSSSLTDSRWAKLHEQISSIVTLLGCSGDDNNDGSRYVSTLLIHTLLMLEDYRALRQFIEQG